MTIVLTILAAPAQKGAPQIMTSHSNAAGPRRTKYFAAPVALLILLLANLVFAMPAGANDVRPTVARLISAAVEISPPLARLEAGLQLVPRGSVLTNAGHLRPAADLGAWARARGYARVTAELGDALAEGSAPDATTRDWTRCYERGNGAAVICPDGYIEVN